MPTRSRVTRESILETAAAVVSEAGVSALTFQALGDRLGVSKQAIIYWFPNKADLTRALVVPALQLEAEAVAAALRRVRTARKAIEIFLRTLIAFHLGDLGRFRLIYISAQQDLDAWRVAELPVLADAIHAATGQMYGALEALLANASDFDRRRSPRQIAVAAHMSAIGLLSMLSLADAVHDPMAHAPDALIDALVALNTGWVVVG